MLLIGWREHQPHTGSTHNEPAAGAASGLHTRVTSTRGVAAQGI